MPRLLGRRASRPSNPEARRRQPARARCSRGPSSAVASRNSGRRRSPFVRWAHRSWTPLGSRARTRTTSNCRRSSRDRFRTGPFPTRRESCARHLMYTRASKRCRRRPATVFRRAPAFESARQTCSLSCCSRGGRTSRSCGTRTPARSSPRSPVPRHTSRFRRR